MPVRPARAAARGLLVSAGVGALLTGPVAAASAHVTVHPDTTAAGSFAELVFRVPTESDTASTVGVTVQLPTTTPLAYVSVRPVPGWSARVVEAALPTPVEADGATLTRAARSVTWTADRGAGVRPGEYQDFAISGGPLPESGDLVLPAVQTYSDGEVVRWDQPTLEGGEEPEHPAPAFAVTAAAAPDAHGHAGTAAAASQSSLGVDQAPAPDSLARWLGAGGLAVGLAGSAVAALALRRRPGT